MAWSLSKHSHPFALFGYPSCPLPQSSLETIIHKPLETIILKPKVSNISTILQLMGSRDPQIANYNIILVIGQKWRVDEEVKNLETDIFNQKVVGSR